jgi:hypothetical protein
MPIRPVPILVKYVASPPIAVSRIVAYDGEEVEYFWQSSEPLAGASASFCCIVHSEVSEAHIAERVSAVEIPEVWRKDDLVEGLDAHTRSFVLSAGRWT